MAILTCYVDEETLKTLTEVSEETGRSIEDLAEAAIAESACDCRRDKMGSKANG